VNILAVFLLQYFVAKNLACLPQAAVFAPCLATKILANLIHELIGGAISSAHSGF